MLADGKLRCEAARFAWNAALALATLCSGASTALASDREIPVEAFFRPSDIRTVGLSPSGRKLALTTTAGGRRSSLIVFDLPDLDKPTVVAAFDEVDVASFNWVNDDRLVFRLYDLKRGAAMQAQGRGLFSVKTDGTEMRQLIKRNPNHVGESTRFGREALDMDHVLLSIPHDGGNEVIVGHLNRDAGGAVSSVLAMRLDVTTRATRSLSHGIPPHVRSWLFDPRGEARLAVAVHGGRMLLHWRDPTQGGWKRIANFAALEPEFSPFFVDAQGQLYVVTKSGPQGYDVLKRFDFATGKPEVRDLVSTPGFDVQATLLVALEEPGPPLGMHVTTDAQTTHWYEPRMQKVQEAVNRHLPGRVNSLSCRRCRSDDPVVLVVSWSDREPGEYWLYHAATDRLQAIGRRRPAIDSRQMGTRDFHRIRARDGLDLPVWVTLPPGADDKKPRPAVVWVHGGPWARGGVWDWQPESQLLASRGYVVIEPEFRGSLGFG